MGAGRRPSGGESGASGASVGRRNESSEGAKERVERWREGAKEKGVSEHNMWWGSGCIRYGEYAVTRTLHLLPAPRPRPGCRRHRPPGRATGCRPRWRTRCHPGAGTCFWRGRGVCNSVVCRVWTTRLSARVRVSASRARGERGEEETGCGAQGCRTVLDLRQDYRPAQRRGVGFVHSIRARKKRHGFLRVHRPPATRADGGAVRGGEHTNVPGRARGRGGGWGLQGGSPARHTFFMTVRGTVSKSAFRFILQVVCFRSHAHRALLHTRTRAEHFAWYRRHACHKHRTTGVVARPFGPLTRPVLPR